MGGQGSAKAIDYGSRSAWPLSLTRALLMTVRSSPLPHRRTREHAMLVTLAAIGLGLVSPSVAGASPATPEQDPSGNQNAGVQAGWAGTVAESSWTAMKGRPVEILTAEGIVVSGTLEGVEGPAVVVIQTDGTVVALDKARATALRVPTVTSPASASPTGSTSTSPTSPLPSPPSPPPGPPPRHWAVGGAITGFVAGGLTLLFGVASEATLWTTDAEQIPALPLGSVATLIATVGVPVAAAGAKSARRATGVRGLRGARITGWVFYAVGLTNAVALIALGASEVTPFPGQITVGTLMLSSSSILMGVDALAGARESRVATSQRALTPPPLRLGYTTLRVGGAPVGGVATLAGRF